MEDKKLIFEEPETEFILLFGPDVITTSGPAEFEDIKD